MVAFKPLATILLALSLAGAMAANAKAQAAFAEILGADGAPKGRIDLVETPRGVLIKLELGGLPTGSLGFHIHEVGRCEPPFQSAGGHFNPAGVLHGFLTSGGGHAGDLPNLTVPESGAVRAEFFMVGVTLKDGEPESLLDAEGSAFIIHAGPDDYRSDPVGNSGGRIACGVIRQ
jgi:Cu-Zn family superoxide dismutase